MQLSESLALLLLHVIVVLKVAPVSLLRGTESANKLSRSDHDAGSVPAQLQSVVFIMYMQPVFSVAGSSK